MTSFMNDNILLIKMDSRLETGNSADAEKFIMDEIAEHTPEYVVLDADKLEYISSSGLRVLLNVKRTVDNTQIINVCQGVYEILDMTGFTEILDVKKAFRNISVDGCKMIGKGGFGETYQIDDDHIVKVYNAGILYEDIVREKENARAAFVSGVPTAIPFDTVSVGDRFGNVYELINSSPLGEVISSDPSNIDKYAQQTAALLKTLSAAHAQPGKFRRFVDIVMDNINILDRYIPDEPLFTPDEKALVKRLFDSVPERGTLIHGDFHTHNIFSQGDELLLIDMADTSTGHPLFELGNMYFAFIMIGRRSPERTFPLTGLYTDKAAYFFNKVWEYFLPDFTEKDMQLLTGVCEVIGFVRMMIVAVTSSALNAFPLEIRRRRLSGMKDELRSLYFDRAEKVLEDVKYITGKF